MNLTLPYIPETVKRAIANKRFEVFKDRHSQDPSFIGRVVPSTENGERDWSVVAVVTPGQDEGGRSTSFYRYFLCEGRDSLWKILAWMEHYQQQPGGKWPVFDPFASKQVGESHQWNVNAKPKLKLPDDWQSFLNENQTPAILKRGDASNLKMINAMAEVKANSEQVSWAYNVEVIERPEQFIIIQAANEESYQRLMQKRQSQANNARLMPLSVDEAAIRKAINALISGSQVRDEWIQTILATLEGNQVTVEQWEAVFDDQGAGTAIKKGSADLRMGRLLTLRAFVLPETLPEFLGWLWPIEGKKKQENPQKKASQEFQSKLISKLNQRPHNFTDGIKKALKALLEKEIPVVSVIWLFNANAGGSIWRPYRRPLVEDVRTDLIAIRDSLSSNGNTPDPRELRCGEEIWSDLCSYRQDSNYRYGNYYKPFAELFAGLGRLENSFDLSAYFYQVSDEQVPKSIFNQGVSNVNGDEGEVYGLIVQRKIDLPEKARRFVVKYAKIILIVSLLLSTHGAIYLWGKNNGYQLGKTDGFNDGYKKGLAEVNVALPTSRNDRITEKEKEIAIKNFTKTVETIENIVSELAKLKIKGTENQPLRKEIIGEVQNALVVNKDDSKELDYEKATSRGLLGWGIDWSGEIARAKNEWVEAIYISDKQAKLVSS
ncbi:MAG: hypothetical protein GDA56_02995 [Hormoscilla sp. GM7CHS1pb]|nr:hypothetical protein [Hormoscilla sp. GM7CHS1pb]